jgi:hypothetical protein
MFSNTYLGQTGNPKLMPIVFLSVLHNLAMRRWLEKISTGTLREQNPILQGTQSIRRILNPSMGNMVQALVGIESNRNRLFSHWVLSIIIVTLFPTGRTTQIVLLFNA